jgi:hypothetical protein
VAGDNMHDDNNKDDGNQGDQIGRILAHWTIVYICTFGQVFENY